MADISELLELGKQIEYTGMELQEFVAKRQELQREERRLRREEETDKRRVEENTEKRTFQHKEEAKEAEHRREMKRLELQVDQERWKAEQERKAYAEGDAYKEDQFKVRQSAPPKFTAIRSRILMYTKPALRGVRGSALYTCPRSFFSNFFKHAEG